MAEDILNPDVTETSKTETSKNATNVAVKLTTPPRTVSFKANIMSVDEAANGNIVVNVSTPDGDIKQLWVAAKYWAILGKRLREGDFIQVKTELRIAGKTQYAKNGAAAFHDKDGEGFVSANRISKSLFDADVPANQADIDLITTAPTDGMASAVANYLASVRGSMIGAAK